MIPCLAEISRPSATTAEYFRAGRGCGAALRATGVDFVPPIPSPSLSVVGGATGAAGAALAFWAAAWAAARTALECGAVRVVIGAVALERCSMTGPVAVAEKLTSTISLPLPGFDPTRANFP